MRDHTVLYANADVRRHDARGRGDFSTIATLKGVVHERWFRSRLTTFGLGHWMNRYPVYHLGETLTGLKAQTGR